MALVRRLADVPRSAHCAALAAFCVLVAAQALRECVRCGAGRQTVPAARWAARWRNTAQSRGRLRLVAPGLAVSPAIYRESAAGYRARRADGRIYGRNPDNSAAISATTLRRFWGGLAAARRRDIAAVFRAAWSTSQ